MLLVLAFGILLASWPAWSLWQIFSRRRRPVAREAGAECIEVESGGAQVQLWVPGALYVDSMRQHESRIRCRMVDTGSKDDGHVERAWRRVSDEQRATIVDRARRDVERAVASYAGPNAIRALCPEMYQGDMCSVAGGAAGFPAWRARMLRRKAPASQLARELSAAAKQHWPRDRDRVAFPALLRDLCLLFFALAVLEGLAPDQYAALARSRSEPSEAQPEASGPPAQLSRLIRFLMMAVTVYSVQRALSNIGTAPGV